MTETLEADYLIVGAGAMGMAFADVIVSETTASVIIVDRYHQPGGHWNTAYPFVRLHQPSAFYGVNSLPLGRDVIDATGHNAGLYELASGGEVVGYFGQVMRQHLLASGRVRYFPMADYEGDGRFHSRLSDETFQVNARRIVDATYMRVTVPSMRAPPYSVAEGVKCVTPNELAKTTHRPSHYTVIGAGKTGIDTCLWLLANRVDPADISWVMPRDSWMLDREGFQPGELFAERYAGNRARQIAALSAATSAEDLLRRLGENGYLLRIDDDVTPTMYRCATISQAELAELKKISNIIRKGRVERLETSSIELQEGRVAANADTLYIDCSADGLEKRPAVPVFEGNTIRLQAVRVCQQVFSAALIAHVEGHFSDETTKNDICRPIPHPDTALDYLRCTEATLVNQLRWAEDPDLVAWLSTSRLDWLGRCAPKLPDDPKQREGAVMMIREMMRGAAAKLKHFQAEAEKAELVTA